MVRREWIDPERGKVALKEYAERWIMERPKLRPRTVALYRQLLRSHIAPYLGATPIAALDAAAVRAWRADLLTRGVSQTVTAKGYRLLRAVLNTRGARGRVDPGQPVPHSGCRSRGHR